MKRLINNGDIFDKYVSFEDKKFREDTIKQLNWQGHRHIAGTYSGAAYTTSLADNYMANNLRNDSNPKGSLLVAAKNYTDQKVAAIGGGKIYLHSISIASSAYYIYINIYSNSNTELTIRTLAELIRNYGNVICTGSYTTSTNYGIPIFVRFDPSYDFIKLYYFDLQNKVQKNTGLNVNVSFSDNVSEIA